MRKTFAIVVAVGLSLTPAVSTAQTKISIDRAVKDCRDAGHGIVAGVQPVQSELKRETSLVGMAYLNYIYQNDIKNKHFCESMLLMSSQVPADTRNRYVDLFLPQRARKTLGALDAVQMCFDHAIARTPAPEAEVKASLARVRKTLN
jgi:hypothetical protein